MPGLLCESLSTNPVGGAPGYIVVHPGSTVPARAWNPALNRQLVESLNVAGHRVVVTGAASESNLCDFVAGTSARNMAGKTSLSELARVIADASAIVVGNTGAAHVAAAVGTPVVSLFAPTIPAMRFRPWMVEHVLLGDQDICCAGCRARVCPRGDHACIDDVRVERRAVRAGAGPQRCAGVAAGPCESMNVAMVSEHASPLASLGSVNAGGQNVHVAALATAIAALGHSVTVYTRRDGPGLPDRVGMACGVVVHHIDAGPATRIAKDAMYPHVAEFSKGLRRAWQLNRPDVVHSHFWMSGVATVAAADVLGIPTVHTYHALGVEKLRHQGSADTSPAIRIFEEARIAREADCIVATSRAEVEQVATDGRTVERD